MAKRTATQKRVSKKSLPKKAAKKRLKPLSTFSRLVSQERKRLEKLRKAALVRKAAIDRELEHVQGELAAIGTFFSRKVAGAISGKGRAKRGERQQQVLDAIKSVPAGLTRGEIIKRLNAFEKSAQQSISNTLYTLLKSKAVKRENRRYRSP